VWCKWDKHLVHCAARIVDWDTERPGLGVRIVGRCVAEEEITTGTGACIGFRFLGCLA
jgi:hypothetical protein